MRTLDRPTLRRLLRRRAGAGSRRGRAGVLTLDITADISDYVAAMQRAADGLRVQRERVQARMAYRQIRKVAGVEARFWVRAGLDPAYRSRRSMIELIERLRWRMPGEWEAFGLTDRERRRVAVAAINGWHASYGHDEAAVELVREVLIWAEESP